jgi:hypothetical protein
LPVLPLLVLGSLLYIVQDIQQNWESPMAKAGALADLSNTYLLVTAVLGLVSACVAVIAQAGGTIAGEREKGTLEALQLTRLTGWQVVGAKLLVAALPAAVLLTVLCPIALAAVLLHGATPAQAALTCAVFLATSAVAVTLGGCCSAFAKRGVTAIIVALLFMLFLQCVFLTSSTLADNTAQTGSAYSQISTIAWILGQWTALFFTLFVWAGWPRWQALRAAGAPAPLQRFLTRQAWLAGLLVLILVAFAYCLHKGMVVESPFSVLQELLDPMSYHMRPVQEGAYLLFSVPMGIVLHLTLAGLLLRVAAGRVLRMPGV